MPLDSLDLAKACREFALDKKATDPVILDLREISSLADYFVICSAQSEPQLKAIAFGLEKSVKETYHLHARRTDGYPASQWIIVDYGDVMVHIFHDEKRGLYSLEELWGDAPRVEV